MSFRCLLGLVFSPRRARPAGGARAVSSTRARAERWYGWCELRGHGRFVRRCLLDHAETTIASSIFVVGHSGVCERVRT